MLPGAFNHTIDTWINALPHYSMEKLLLKPDPESWSLGQVYSHIIHETRYYLQQIETCLNSNEHTEKTMKASAHKMFMDDAFPEARIKGDPLITSRVQQPLSRQQLQEDLLSLKETVNRLTPAIALAQSNGKTMHPGLGYFNAPEWLEFAHMHLRHHLRQKQRIDDFLSPGKVHPLIHD